MKLKAGLTELDLRVGSSQPAGHVPEQPSSVSIDPRGRVRRVRLDAHVRVMTMPYNPHPEALCENWRVRVN
jgi:hypothetical protein